MNHTTEEGNFLIANFIGYKYPDMNNAVFMANLHDLHCYHENWNLLMPACKKWVHGIYVPIDIRREHQKRSQNLNSILSTYDPANAFDLLVENIQWYNSITTNPTQNEK